MLKKIVMIEQRILHRGKEYVPFLLANILFGCAVYYMLMACNLVNDGDGVWHLSNYVAGIGEISSGRGLLRYVDKLHFGIVSVPFLTFIALLLFSIANTVMMAVLKVEGSILRCLLSFFLIANPVVCMTLTFSYTAVGYAAAYLFAVLAVVPFRYFKNMFRIFLCGICIAISMSCYQAYLGVTCVLLLFLLICMIREEEKPLKLLAYMRDAF